MKIKKLKYILGLLFGLLLISNITFSSGCSDDMSSGSRPNPSACQGTDDWFDNHYPNGNDNVALFLKIIDKPRNNCSAQNVRNIQSVMQSIGGACSTCMDGRYGHHTETAIASCLTMVCTTDGKQMPTLNNGELTCGPGYEIKKENGINCCTQVNVGAPSIDAPDTYDPYNPGEISVTVNFTDNRLPPFMRGFGIDPTVQGGGNINSIVYSSYNKITFKIQQPFDPSSMTITVPEGQLLYTGRVPSKVATKTLTAKACDKPASGGNCNAYGPSYTVLENCCATNCSKPQNTGGNCDAGYRIEGNCCVVDECQTPPISGSNNDCTNQFGGRGVYNAEIDCCIDSGSCINPPVSPGQCSGNLVLDSAGQCCITCEHPVNGSGNCQEGFTAQGNCCFADNMCGSGVNMGGQCHECTGDTIANENHTKCICNPDLKCCGIQLNTVVPFIGDCIELNTDSHRGDTTVVTSVTAFPILMQGLMKILMSAIMVFSFLMVIVAGLMMTTGAFSNSSFSKGKTILKNVIISLILLGCSGLILSLINPSFFGG